jgi:hypothetical protein
MATVEFGNFYYFFYIGLAVVLIVLGYFLLRKKSYEFKYKTLLIILFMNLGLHFIKMFFDPCRSELPWSWTSITFENICAGSTLVFPFLFWQKKYKFLHNYMFFIGVCGGAAALAYPTQALGESPIIFETIRFYVCHISLIAIPVLAAMLGVYKPELSIKSILFIPVCFLVHETIILINELFLIAVGLVQTDLATFLSSSGERNASFIFGPWPSFAGAGKIITIFTPSFMLKDVFMINGGVDFYWPVIWMAIPAFIYLPIVYAILSSPFWLPEFIKNKKKGVKPLTETQLEPESEVTDTAV